jgi:hypothetical protein
MQGLPRIRYTPRTGASYESAARHIGPGADEAAQCDDTLTTLVLLDSLPDILLPALAWAASHKQYITRVAVKTLVKGCGAEFLERCLGKTRPRELMIRYAEGKTSSGL